MPEAGTIDQETTAVALTLMAKYAVDQESVQQTTRDVEQAERSVKQIREEMQSVERREFKAFQDLAREEQKTHFDEMERAIDAHWRRRLQMVRGNVDEERRILESHGADLMKLDQLRQQATQSSEHQEAARAGVTGEASAMSGGMPGAGLLGSIGWGSMMGMFSFAGMAGMVANSVEQLRSARTEAREVGEMAQRDPEFSFGLASNMQMFKRETAGRFTPEQMGRFASEIAPFAPGGFAGGQMVGGLTEQAAQLGVATGIDPQTLTRLMRQFHVLEGTALPDTINRVFELTKSAEAAGMPMKDFAALVSQMTEEGRRYNRTIPESTQLITQFSRELQEGTITVSQISQMQTAAARAPIGIHALLGEKFLSQGGGVADFLRGIGAADDYSAGVALKSLAEGGLPTATGDVVAPTEQNAAQRKQVANLRRQIEHALPSMIEEMGQGAAPGMSAVARGQIIRDMFSDLLGVGGSTAFSSQDLIDQEQGRRASTGAIGPRAGGRPRTLEETLAEGEKSILDSVSNLDKFKNAVGTVADSLALQAEWVLAKVRGDDAAAARISKQLGEYGGEGPLGTSGTFNALSAVPRVGTGPGAGLAAMSNVIRVIVENRAKDDVEVRTPKSNGLIAQH